MVIDIFKGLDWESIFYQFKDLFRNNSDDTQTTYNKNGSDRLSESLMNVYPILYETLETNKIEFFKKWIQHNPDTTLYGCNHEWKEHYIFRCGKFEECIRCRYTRLK